MQRVIFITKLYLLQKKHFKMVMKKIYTLVTVLCFYIINAQQYSQKFSDLSYVNDGQVYHKLDIYLPKTTKSKYPVVIHIYGSAFMSNNGKGSADLSTVVASLLNAGFAVVTPNHRSSSDAIYPAQIQDVKAVIRFLRGNSATYKLDTSFVGISGFSSGGQLASLAGTTRNVKRHTRGSITMDLEGTLGSFTSFRSYVHAVCDWSGPTDFLKMDSCGSSYNNNAADSPASKLIGVAIQQNKDLSQMTNPITYVDPTDPAFLIIHGTSDNIVPYCESVFLNNALKANNVNTKLITVQNGGHSVSSTYLNDMVQFFLGQVTITSVDDITANNTENDLYINGSVMHITNASNIVTLNLIDMSGKNIYATSNSTEEINLDFLKSGIYVAKIQYTDGTVLTKKIYLEN